MSLGFDHNTKMVALRELPTLQYTDEAAFAKMVVLDPAQAARAVMTGEREMVLFPLTAQTGVALNNSLEKDAPHVFDWYNGAVEPDYVVPGVTANMLLDPDAMKSAWAPFAGSSRFPRRRYPFAFPNLTYDGSTHYYGSHVEDTLVQDANMVAAIDTLMGDTRWRLHQRDLQIIFPRIAGSQRDSGKVAPRTNRVHILAGASGKCSFVWYRGTATKDELKQRVWDIESRLRVGQAGVNVPYAKLSTFHNLRRRIVFDPTKYVLLYRSDLLIEQDKHSCGTRIHLDPYITPMPTRTRVLIQRTIMQPEQFLDSATVEETEKIGLMYAIAGKQGAGGKFTYQICHPRCYNTMVKRVRERYVVSGNLVRACLPDWGTHRSTAAQLEACGMDAFPMQLLDAVHFPCWTVNPVARWGTNPVLQFRRGLRNTLPGQNKRHREE